VSLQAKLLSFPFLTAESIRTVLSTAAISTAIGALAAALLISYSLHEHEGFLATGLLPRISWHSSLCFKILICLFRSYSGFLRSFSVPMLA
jgi:hypothetical protein